MRKWLRKVLAPRIVRSVGSAEGNLGGRATKKQRQEASLMSERIIDVATKNKR